MFFEFVNQASYNTKINPENISVVISENKSVNLDDFITSDEVELHAITKEYDASFRLCVKVAVLCSNVVVFFRGNIIKS